MITLEIQKREDSENLNKLREEGVIPAVMYGSKEKAVSVSVSKKEFEKVLKEAGESTVITLNTKEGKKSAMIHDIQFDPVKDIPVHVDFYVVEAGKEIEVNVPIDFIGVSVAIKELNGTLVKVLHELPIKGIPSKLPHSIEVDISVLEQLDSHIKAKDISLPDGIMLAGGDDDIVASISVAKEEEEEVEESDLSSIEVQKKGKKEEEAPEE